MPYSEELAERIREVIGGRHGVTERRCSAEWAGWSTATWPVARCATTLLVRLDRDDTDRVLAEPNVRLMEMGGRTMRGFFTVDAAAIADDAELARWVDSGAAYAASLPPK